MNTVKDFGGSDCPAFHRSLGKIACEEELELGLLFTGPELVHSLASVQTGTLLGFRQRFSIRGRGHQSKAGCNRQVWGSIDTGGYFPASGNLHDRFKNTSRRSKPRDNKVQLGTRSTGRRRRGSVFAAQLGWPVFIPIYWGWSAWPPSSRWHPEPLIRNSELLGGR